MFSGDFEAFLDCFELPHPVETFEGRRVIEDRVELHAVFQAVRRHYKSLGVTMIARHCVEATFKGANTVEATHMARLMRRNALVQAPYPVFSVLRRVGGFWKIAHSKYAIADAPKLSSVIVGPEHRHIPPPHGGDDEATE